MTKIDYLTYTVNATSTGVVERLRECLPGGWLGKEHAQRPYTRTMTCGGVSIQSDAPNDERARVEVRGAGCRELEHSRAVTDWPEYLTGLLRAGADFSRLDVALDDRDGTLDMDTILRYCKDRRVVCRYNKITPQEPLCPTTGQFTGRMVTFGSRGSETFIRIYDKALKEGESGHWLRVELEARDARAQALAAAIAKGGGGIVPGVLLGCLDFKERGPSPRRERWPTAPWWTAFLGTQERQRLTTAPRNVSVENRYCWLIRQVSPSFAQVYDGGMGDRLTREMLAQGRLRMERTPRRRGCPAGVGD